MGRVVYSIPYQEVRTHEQIRRFSAAAIGERRVIHALNVVTIAARKRTFEQ